MREPTKIQDLPHFLISSIERGETDPHTKRATFRLLGRFDKLNGVREGRCWLLLPDRDWLIGDLESLDEKDHSAVFIDYKEPMRDLVGMRLPYVYGSWQAYHVWMVSDPAWPWTRLQLEREEIIAEVVHTEESQTPEGQKVRIWIRVKESGEQTGKERWYPAVDDDEARRKVAEIKAAGWDHEHCQLCQSSIKIGDLGFTDGDEHWVCEGCYEKYVATHDLSFLINE